MGLKLKLGLRSIFELEHKSKVFFLFGLAIIGYKHRRRISNVFRMMRDRDTFWLIP
jgi:hypothetical protein